MLRWLAAVLVVVGMAIAAVIGVRFLMPVPEGKSGDQQAAVQIGGPFTLTDQTGKQVTEQDYRGRYLLVYFGYTFCPDLCPLGLSHRRRHGGPAAGGPGAGGAAVHHRRPGARHGAGDARLCGPVRPGAGGPDRQRAEIDQAVRAYRVYARKSDAPAPDGNYLVDHSVFTFLMDRDGRYLTHFGHDVTPEEMSKRIAELVGTG